MNEKQKKLEILRKEYRKWRRINIWTDRVILSVLLALIVFIGSGLLDGVIFLEEGIKSIEYHSFSQLRDINADIAAWLTIDGTHIDHPVVRSADNFDYLDKGFDGSFYAGGTLFMDMNNRSFEDAYCMIHGHHMTGGAMFGDLDRFLDEEFFERNRTGALLTPDYDYDIDVFAAGVFDAYDRNIYKTGGTFGHDYVKKKAMYYRETGPHGHVLALSTCMDDMTDNRAVVFCDLVNRRKHR